MFQHMGSYIAQARSRTRTSEALLKITNALAVTVYDVAEFSSSPPSATKVWHQPRWNRNAALALIARTTLLEIDSSASYQQLNNIYEAVRPNSKAAGSRSRLLRLMIERNAFDPTRGLYIPVTKDVWLKGKLPVHSETSEACWLVFRDYSIDTGSADS